MKKKNLGEVVEELREVSQSLKRPKPPQKIPGKPVEKKKGGVFGEIKGISNGLKQSNGVLDNFIKDLTVLKRRIQIPKVGESKKKKRKLAFVNLPPAEVTHFETGVDHLLQLLEENKKMTDEQAANELLVDKEKILEWATILEDHKLIKIHYPPIGGIEMKKA